MLENFDDFLLCRPYVRIWALVVGTYNLGLLNQNFINWEDKGG